MAKILRIEDNAGTAFEICLASGRHGHQLAYAWSAPEEAEPAKKIQLHFMIVDSLSHDDTAPKAVVHLRARR